MKVTKFLSILSLSVIGAFGGAASAWAVPLLGTDLSTFTVLGSSTVTNVPTSTINGNVGVWSAGGANAVTGFNSIPNVATADTQVTGGQCRPQNPKTPPIPELMRISIHVYTIIQHCFIMNLFPDPLRPTFPIAPERFFPWV